MVVSRDVVDPAAPDYTLVENREPTDRHSVKFEGRWSRSIDKVVLNLRVGGRCCARAHIVRNTFVVVFWSHSYIEKRVEVHICQDVPEATSTHAIDEFDGWFS